LNPSIAEHAVVSLATYLVQVQFNLEDRTI